MKKNVSSRNTREKALRINLDEMKYGSIAEIGAGQEVAREFFKAGAAAGTIAKTMSAYDMQFSDAIYGVQEDRRYVCRDRVNAMLEKEYDLVINRVATSRSRTTRYFAYATTVAAKSFRGNNECHAWCGIRLQMYPDAPPSQIIVHVRLLDDDVDRQQSALGTFGVNLIYAAFYYYENPKTIIDSLADNLEPDRIEIDLINFSGPYFDDVDNRALNLYLIRSWNTRAILFQPDGNVTIPAEMLYKKNVLTIRGTFQPITRLNVDMMEQGMNFFTQTDGVTRDNSVALAEISLNDIQGHDLNISESDLIERVSLLTSLGYSVMVSDYTRYFSLRAYFRQFTQLQIGIVLGVVNIRAIFDEQRYIGIEGGILEAFGKLFPDHTRLLVYPEIDADGKQQDYTTVKVPENLRYLYQHLIENGKIFGIECSDPELFKIFSREVFQQIQGGAPGWEDKVPEGVAEEIKNNRLFGYRG
jgi:hypothetical protein